MKKAIAAFTFALLMTALTPSVAEAYDYVLCITQSVSTASGPVDVGFDWCFDKSPSAGDGCVVLRTVTPKLSGDQSISAVFYTDAGGLPLTLTEIGEGAFKDSPSLTSVTLPITCQSVGNYAFSNCTILTSVTLSNHIRALGKAPFFGSRITELTLPSDLESIDGNPAIGCTRLKSINVFEDNPDFFSEDGLLYDWSGETLLACPPTKKSIELPYGLLSIGEGAFAGCKYLTSIVAKCDEPTAVDVILKDTPTRLVVEADAYTLDWGDPNRTEWKGRKFTNTGTPPGFGTYETGDAVISYSYSTLTNTATILSVKPTAETVLSGNFEIPSSIGSYVVTAIGPCAFANHKALESVSIPATCLSVGDFAFSNCTALSSVSLSYGVRYIGNRPFVNTIVREIALPDSVLDMYGNIAAGALFSTKINVSDSSHFVSTEDGCIYNKDKTRLYSCPGRAEETVKLPETLTEIMPDAFYGCFRLTQLEIPATVTTIGSKAFNVSGIWPDVPALESKPKLTSVYYNGATPIADAADDIYEGTSAELTSYATTDEWKALLPTWKGRSLVVTDDPASGDATWTDENENIWSYSISGKTATITGVTLATGVETTLSVPNIIGKYPITAIADNAFAGLTSLETVTLPDGIISIGKTPFSGTRLQSLSIPYTVTSINGNPLVGCDYAQAIEVAALNKFFATADGHLFNKTKTELLACVPTSAAITLPETVTSIAKDAFAGCTTLETVTALCDEPDADNSIFDDTPITLVIQADAYALDWGNPERLTWKGRLFENTGTPLPEGPQTYVDANKVEWTYTVASDRTIEIGTTQTAVQAITAGDLSIPETIAVDGIGNLSVTTIGSKAFNDCSGLTSISIPSGVTSIQPGAFNGCTNLASFTVASANTSYKASATTGALYTKDGKTLIKVPATFKFKTVLTITEKTEKANIEEHHLYKQLSKGAIAEFDVYTITNGSVATSTSTSTQTIVPDLSVSVLLSNVSLIGDYAFCDCGFYDVALPTSISTVDLPSGGYVNNSKLHYAYRGTETTVTTTTTAEVPFPEIPSTVAYSKASFAGSVWEGQVTVETLPELGSSPTTKQIASALTAASDTRVRSNITTAQDYADFRTWAISVKNTSGQLAGNTAVMNSTAAWTAFALDLDTLPSVTPTDADVKLEKSSISGTSTLKLLVSIDGLEIGSNATENRLKTVFNISGSSTCDPLDFSADNVNLTFGTPVNGKVPVSAEPASSGTTSFFIKAGLK